MLLADGRLNWLKVLFVASRLGGWTVSYVLLADLTRYTDLVLYYYPEAVMVTEGRLPYLDFPTSYGPLFPFVSSALLPFWKAPAAVAFVMVLIEIMAVLWFVDLVARRDESGKDRATWTLAVYLVNPAALYWSGMMGYNSSLVLLCWVGAVGALTRNRFAASGIWLAVSVIAGKFLGVLAAPFWLAHPRRRYGVVAAMAILAVSLWYVGLRYQIDLALPLIREGHRSTAGNLWFLSAALAPSAPDGALWRYGPLALLAITALGLSGWLALRWREVPRLEQICGALSAMGWLFLVLSKKSFPHYAPMFLLFTVAAMCARGSSNAAWAVLLAVIGAVGILEPGLWNALGQPESIVKVTGSALAIVPLVAADLVLVCGGLALAAGSAAVAAGQRS